MEIVVNFLDLSEVLVLHSAPCLALSAVLSWVWEQNLVNDNVVDVDLLLGKLNRKSLRFVHAEELGDANGHKCSLVAIFKLLVHLFNLCLHGIDAIKEALLCVLTSAWVAICVHHLGDLREHASKLVLKFNQLHKSFLKNVWEVQQA